MDVWFMDLLPPPNPSGEVHRGGGAAAAGAAARTSLPTAARGDRASAYFFFALLGVRRTPQSAYFAVKS